MIEMGRPMNGDLARALVINKWGKYIAQSIQ
jgi:hypothetical protein